MTFEAQHKSVQDNGSYEGAKIYRLQKLEPEQWRFCDTIFIHALRPSLNRDGGDSICSPSGTT